MTRFEPWYRMLTRLASALIAGAVFAACTGDGVRSEAWPDGSPRKSGPLIQGRQQGQWKFWHPNGRTEAEGGFRNDHQHGEWVWWHENGQTKQRGHYLDGQRSGPWTFWYDNGQLFCTGDYQRDQQVGMWRYFHPNGTPSSAGVFIEGRRALAWTRWADDRTPIDQGGYHAGAPVGPWVTFARAGAALRRRDFGVPAGFQVYREPLQGEAPTRWGMLRDQRPVGLWMTWNPTGNLQAAMHADDDGAEWLGMHPDGALQSAGRLRNDRRDGHWRWWAVDGSAAADMLAGATGRELARTPPWSAVPVDDAPGAHAGLEGFHDRDRLQLTALRAPLVETIEATPPPPPPPPPEFTLNLSPAAVLPGFWTVREERNAAALGNLYLHATPLPAAAGSGYAPGYGDPSSGTAAPGRGRSDLVGKPMPVNRLLSAQGEVLDLTERRGKRNILLIVLRGFFGQVCVYCASHTAAVAKAMDRFEAAETEVIWVYPGPADAVLRFLDSVRSLGGNPPPGAFAYDVDLHLVEALKIGDRATRLARPTSLIIDRNGVVQYAYIGEQPVDRPPVPELLNRLRELNSRYLAAPVTPAVEKR